LSIFVIAEIGINHNGNIERGKNLIDACKFAGADCAKFQMRNIKELYRDSTDYKDEDLSSQYVLDLLNKFSLDNDQLFELFDYCKEIDILPMCTPWDFSSFYALEDYGMTMYKTASADLTNLELLKAIAITGKKMFVSTGMSTEEEIIEAQHLLSRRKADYHFLHCNSTYPTPFKDVNLKYLKRLQELTHRDVGYSGHERGIFIPMAAVALGAKMIEKHITLSKDLEGNDHRISLLPDEFKDMVTGIRQVDEASGLHSSYSDRKCSPGELINRESLAKSIVAGVDIKKDQLIERELLDIKSPGRGLQPNRIKDVVGKVAKRDIPKGNFLYEFDIRDIVSARKYQIHKKWGVPVRFHDYKFFLENSNPKFLEFHLSYNDLSFDVENKFKGIKHDIDLTVHSPDIFSGDHLADLSSNNSGYRNLSINNFKEVINITKALRPHFTTSGKTKIIASVGGFTRNDPMSESEKRSAYERVASSLFALEDDETEIIIQTVPPFPWYFGGQLLLNLFVTSEDIAEFCSRYDRRICLDVSHSQLACNSIPNGKNLNQFIKTVHSYVSHMHIADAYSLDQEGLQLGLGDIDFKTIFDTMDKETTFIPEIWQGHRNFGEECWKALEYIEQKLV
jgi:sialic acid synthase SpsE/sugar phosphate isomerase/epimerase